MCHKENEPAESTSNPPDSDAAADQELLQQLQAEADRTAHTNSSTTR